MIKLFVTDLDGCIATPFLSPDWKSITQIRALNQKSKNDPLIPPLTICSGRPFPYVEAVGQWLDVEKPMLFESGGGLYDIKINELTWNPHFNDEAKEAVSEIKSWIETTLIKNYPGTYPEFAKYTDAGLVNPDPDKIAAMYLEVQEFLGDGYPMFEVHTTDVSVNIILKKANKGEGINFLCKKLGLKPNELAYIGDSSGDMPAIKMVGMSFAPLNAKAFVRNEADHVVSDTTRGVLEAYEILIDKNRSESESIQLK